MSITDDQPVQPLPELDEIRHRYREERDKRLRADGPDQYIQVNGSFARYTDDPWADPDFTRQPLHDEVEVLVVGGGFGGKCGFHYEAHVAALSRAARRPVRLVFSRREEFIAPDRRREGMIVELTSGVRKDGTLLHFAVAR